MEYKLFEIYISEAKPSAIIIVPRNLVMVTVEWKIHSIIEYDKAVMISSISLAVHLMIYYEFDMHLQCSIPIIQIKMTTNTHNTIK